MHQIQETTTTIYNGSEDDDIVNMYLQGRDSISSIHQIKESIKKEDLGQKSDSYKSQESCTKSTSSGKCEKISARVEKSLQRKFKRQKIQSNPTIAKSLPVTSRKKGEHMDVIDKLI